jgi:tetratricopeptide (TPR) repeat protein
MSLRLQILGQSSRCVAGIVAFALFVAPVSPAAAAPSEADMSLARIEYDKGEKAYRLGQFQDAAVAFEKAYEKSGLPDILYNIGLSHLRWYDVDPDLAHLRKARVVFQNYIIEIQKNPELGDLEEAEALIKQIDEKIAQHEQAAAAALEGERKGSVPVDYGPDPGKQLRLGGAIAMGVGGAMVVGGIVSGVVLGVRGQEFEENLKNSYAKHIELGCSANDARIECDRLDDEIAVYRRNGRTANALAVGLSSSLAGVGLIGIVAGAVLFVQGNKKTKRWEERQLSLVPSWGREGGGLVLSGRF